MEALIVLHEYLVPYITLQTDMVQRQIRLASEYILTAQANQSGL